MNQFRFQHLEIWQMSIQVTDRMFDVADELEAKRLYKFAEQLRGAGLSIPNNIAEGAGSFSKREFSNFLNMERRSAFECANILIILSKRKLLSEEKLAEFLNDLDLNICVGRYQTSEKHYQSEVQLKNCGHESFRQAPCTMHHAPCFPVAATRNQPGGI